MKKSPHKPTVRQLIMSASGITVGRRGILAEVCSMCEGAERKCFDANNRFLAEKYGMEIPHVSRHLKALVDCGLLVRVIDTVTSKRCFSPCPELIEAYQIGKGAITNLVRAKVAEHKASTITNLVSPPYQIGKPPITKLVSPPITNLVMDPYQIGNHNVLEHDKRECCKENVDRISILQQELSVALATASSLVEERDKAIADLKKGRDIYRKLLGQHEELKAEVATLKASHTGGAAKKPKQAASATQKPKKESESIPVYAAAVEVFYQAHQRIMLTPVVKFTGMEGKQIKEVLKSLYSLGGVNDWEQALQLFAAICENWDNLGKWYAGKFTTQILHGQLNSIVGTLRIKSEQGASQYATASDFEGR